MRRKTWLDGSIQRGPFRSFPCSPNYGMDGTARIRLYPSFAQLDNSVVGVGSIVGSAETAFFNLITTPSGAEIGWKGLGT